MTDDVKAATPNLDNITFVLSRTTEPMNVGAAARALKTMGLSKLVLIKPRDPFSERSRVVAHGSEDVLDALARIDNEQGPLASCQGAGHFIVKIDVARGVDEVEHVGVAFVVVVHGDRRGLDGDATLAFKVHIVKNLLLLVAGGDGFGQFEHAVSEGALAVVDVGYD